MKNHVFTGAGAFVLSWYTFVHTLHSADDNYFVARNLLHLDRARYIYLREIASTRRNISDLYINDIFLISLFKIMRWGHPYVIHRKVICFWPSRTCQVAMDVLSIPWHMTFFKHVVHQHILKWWSNITIMIFHVALMVLGTTTTITIAIRKVFEPHR